MGPRTNGRRIGALLVAAFVAATPGSVAADVPRAVIELFTSQGCAACPPADALMGEYAADEAVVALTYPVKLWDFLGWADTLAKDEHTARQKAYAEALGADVFTPQAVVNGVRTVVGSDAEALERAIEASADVLTVPITLAVQGDVLTVSLGAGEVGQRGAKVWLAIVEDTVEVAIGGGENRGRALLYHNVVRDIRPIAIWKGEAETLEIPFPMLDRDAAMHCVVLLQRETFEGPGRIIGAASVSDMFARRPVVSLPAARPTDR